MQAIHMVNLILKATLMLFFFLSSTSTTYAQEQTGKTPPWKITRLYQDPNDDEHKADDPELLYFLELNEKSQLIEVPYKTLKPILEFTRKTKPENLVPYSFEAIYGDPNLDFDYLRVKAITRGKYKPPTKEELQEKAAADLAKMDCPDFSEVDRHTASQVFLDGFQGSAESQKKWLDAFKKKIQDKSGGKYRVEQANIDDFPYRIRGPAEYLKLTDGKKEKKFILGPYSTPFSCGLVEPIDSPIHKNMRCHTALLELKTKLETCLGKAAPPMKRILPLDAKKTAEKTFEEYEIKSFGLDRGARYTISAKSAAHIAQGAVDKEWADDETAIQLYDQIFLQPLTAQLRRFTEDEKPNRETVQACLKAGIPSDGIAQCQGLKEKTWAQLNIAAIEKRLLEFEQMLPSSMRPKSSEKPEPPKSMKMK